MCGSGVSNTNTQRMDRSARDSAKHQKIHDRPVSVVIFLQVAAPSSCGPLAADAARAPCPAWRRTGTVRSLWATITRARSRRSLSSPTTHALHASKRRRRLVVLLSHLSPTDPFSLPAPLSLPLSFTLSCARCCRFHLLSHGDRSSCRARSAGWRGPSLSPESKRGARVPHTHTPEKRNASWRSQPNLFSPSPSSNHTDRPHSCFLKRSTDLSILRCSTNLPACTRASARDWCMWRRTGAVLKRE